MATTNVNDSNNKRNQTSTKNSGGAAPAAAPAKPPRRRGWLRYFLVFTALSLTFVALAPTIISYTPLGSWVLRKAAPINGSIAVRSIALGWFTTPQVWGLELRDAQNQPVLAADHIMAPATLINLILGRTGTGTLLIEKPKLSLVLSNTGSNLEDALATLLKSSSSSSSGSTSSAGVDLNVVVADGDLSVTDKPTGQSWHLSGLQAAVGTVRTQLLPTKIEVAAALDNPQQPGSVSLKFHAQPGAAASKETFSPCGLAQTDGNLDLAATNFPLAIVNRVMARAMPGTHLAGTLGAKLSAQWTNLNQVKLQGDATATQLELASPLTGMETLTLNSAHAACQIARADRQVNLTQLLVESDMGNCTAATQIDLGDAGWAGLPIALDQQQGKLQGMVDIAKLAQRMPATMRIRPGTQITSGQLQFKVQATNAAGGRSVQAQLQTSRLAAVDQGRAITWDQPVEATMLVHQTPQGMVVDQLTAQADFGKVTATGTLEQLAVKITTDLKQLTDRLGQFVDLSGLALAGQTDGTLQWHRTADGHFDTSGDLQIKNLLISIPGQKPLSDDSMHVTLTARGITDFAARSRLDAAKLQLVSSVDQIVASVSGPLQLTSLPPALPVQVQWQGHLDTVTHRLPINVALPMLKPDGNYQILAQILAGKDALVVQQGRFALGQPNVAGKDWSVVQPSAEFGFAGRIDLKSGQLDLPSAQLNGVTRWQNATAYGMQIGPGELHTRLVNGVIVADPLQVTCNQGRLSVAPQLKLTPGPVELDMSASTLASQVQFDPALCRSGMERIMPILANVTQAQGVMSVQLQGARIPLFALDKIEAGGQIIVHSAQLQPGPLVQQLALLSTTPISVTQLKPGSVIFFRVTGGRVYHQGLEMELPGMTVKTFGSVGFDDSLKMIAEVTVLPKLLASVPIANTPRQIPIGGTLNQPTIDKAEIARFVQSVFQQTTQGVIQGQLGQQLDNFLSPRK